MVVQFIILLTLSTLICRGTDISKCFTSLGIRDNESRLYLLKGPDTLGRFSVVLYKGENFFDFLFAFPCTKTLLKKVPF